MRTRTWPVALPATALLMTALAGCSGGGRAAPPATAASTPAASPATTPPTTPTPTPTPGPVVAAGDPVSGDVDGDGRPDVVRLVTDSAPQDSPAWRFGVRVSMTRLGTQTVWYGYGEDANEAQQLGRVADVDRDGDGEVLLSPGGSAYGRGWDLLAVVAGRLVRVTGATLTTEQRPDGLSGWGCARELVYAAVARLDGGTYRGTRDYYRLHGATLVRVERHTDTWWQGRTARPEYAADATGC
jgi:hypothetical protein